jgi:pilus assembly protein CpaF
MEFLECLKSILLDEETEDIHLTNRSVSYFKNGQWNSTEIIPDPRKLWAFAQSLAERVDIEAGPMNPSVDSYFTWEHLDRSYRFRAHLVCPPMVIGGPEVTLRRSKPQATNPFLSFEFADSHSEKYLWNSVLRGHSILIFGLTGSGKSSLLKTLLDAIPLRERLLLLEDSQELQLNRKFMTHMVCRNNRFQNRRGTTWNLNQLLFETLRMRPDRIVLGECRATEAFTMFQARMTGHKGLMTTLHADTLAHARTRFHNLVVEGAVSQGLNSFLKSETETFHIWDVAVSVEFTTNNKRKLTVYAKHFE